MPTDADYNTRILRPLASFLRERHGETVLLRVASAADIPVSSLERGNAWISLRAFERFLDEARALFEDDASFVSALTYRMVESYGLMRYLLAASSPGAVYARAAKSYRLMSTVGSPEVVASSDTSCTVRFSTDRRISRLNCLTRQAHSAQLPTFWGLPAATLHEVSCVARGDPACEYQLTFKVRRRTYPAVVGLLVGLVWALAAAWLRAPALTLWAVPLLFALIGYTLELQRSHRANLQFGARQTEALTKLGEEEAEARRELFELHRRQNEWTRLLEQDAAERALTIKNVVARIERSQQARDLQLRGVSHDINSPLTVMRLGLETLAPMVQGKDADGEAVVNELGESVNRMARLLGELMAVTRVNASVLQLTPESVDVGRLCERLGARLRAMVHRKEVLVTVTRTREAPPAIAVDPLLLDRIADNLLSNAAKYTERGSIVVELDGVPGFLLLKVSDSGKGIAPERLEQAFEPGGSDQSARAENSHGLGLSVVVQLLAEVGGRLEVTSEQHVGTTFWVYLPVDARLVDSAPPLRESAPRELIAQVVTISERPLLKSGTRAR